MNLSFATVPKTPKEVANWSFIHAAQHRDYNRVIFQRFGLMMPSYVLDPLDPENMGDWPNLHQIMHDGVDTALGIPGYNLRQLDWSDPDGLQAWVSQHYDQHNRESTILGL